MTKSDDNPTPSEAFREKAVYAIGLTALAVLASTALVFVFHQFYRPELAGLNAGVAFAASALGFFPICAFVGHLMVKQKKTQAALETAKQQAIEADISKSEFLANMSHEIRTPMNGVLGMAELLLSTKLDERQTLFVDTINRSGEALMTVINDILDFSKIEAGRLELDPAPFELREAVEDVVSLLTPRAHEKKLELALRIAPDLPPQIVGDAGRIRQIVTNIVGNAIKFTHEGYVLVDVTGAVPEEGVLELNVLVKDTGIGIPEDKTETIFEKFSQAESSTTRQFGGTGLGLTVAQRLTEAMKGELSVRSKLGKGSTFVFKLRVPIAEGVHHLEQAPEGVEGKRALVIDDLDVNRRIECEQLSVWGLETQTAESGAEALEKIALADAAGRPFDLAIVDYHMPQMDGADFVAKLREEHNGLTPEIIVLSSDDTGEGQARFRALGVAHVHTKPVRSAVFRRSVCAAVSKRVAKLADEAARIARGEDPVEEGGAPIDRRPRVLVAEDNEVNRLVVQSMMSADYDLMFAEDGKEAYELYQVEAFDVILMDVSMPNMDGYEATKAIRAFEVSEGRSRTPIICLTAHAMAEEREASFEQGMDDYVCKPIRREALVEALAKWTGPAAAEKPTEQQSAQG